MLAPGFYADGHMQAERTEQRVDDLRRNSALLRLTLGQRQGESAACDNAVVAGEGRNLTEGGVGGGIAETIEPVFGEGY